ncbi:class I lanthipeptide [Pedobacter sp. AW1-32]|uniref:class I lanthipeptide n=1 Tax=Pedobacter sp. AW1-32 TaxID=3383026 RepID=UPI003FF11D76
MKKTINTQPTKKLFFNKKTIVLLDQQGMSSIIGGGEDILRTTTANTESRTTGVTLETILTGGIISL